MRVEHRHQDVACELTAAQMAERGSEWQDLRTKAGLVVEAIPGGARLWLAGESLQAVTELVRQEAACCGFLDFELTAEGDRLCLDITSAAPEAVGVIEALAGID